MESARWEGQESWAIPVLLVNSGQDLGLLFRNMMRGRSHSCVISSGADRDPLAWKSLPTPWPASAEEVEPTSFTEEFALTEAKPYLYR